jgi:hypothetical protein
MDPSQYKDVTVHGVHYHYYYSAPKSAGNPTLLFLHGFPSTSEHWVHQVVFFENKGYGIIAPDMLGYGGSSKPEDPKAYNGPELAAHCIAILNAEGVDKAVVIAHDWYVRKYSRFHKPITEPSLPGGFSVSQGNHGSIKTSEPLPRASLGIHIPRSVVRPAES